MANVSYKKGERLPLPYAIKKYNLILFCLVALLGVSVLIVAVGFSKLFNIPDNLLRKLLCVGNILVYAPIPVLMVIWSISFLKFLFRGNPYNRGHFILRWRQRKMSRLLQQAMIDEGITNPRQGRLGVEVGDVYPNLAPDKMFGDIEIVGDTASDLAKVKNLINASLREEFSSLIVDDEVRTRNGRWHTFTLIDTSISMRSVPKNIRELIPENLHTLKLSEDVLWDISTNNSALIAGIKGSGKTYFTMGLIAQILCLNCDLYIADPKHSDLINLKSILPDGHVVSATNDILAMFKNAVDIMHERQHLITELAMKDRQLAVDFTTYGLKPVFIILDEVASFIAELDNAQAKQFMAHLKILAMKSRSAGVTLILTTQQPNAKALPTDIREQLSLRLLLGVSTLENRQMVFGTGFEYTDTNFPQGSGLYLLDGKANTPRYIETMDLSEIGDISHSLDVYEDAKKLGERLYPNAKSNNTV